MKRIVIEFSNERLITPSGLALVGAMLGKSELVENVNKASITGKRSQPQIKNGDILLTYIGLLVQGKTEFEAVREMEDDPGYYEMALGISRGIPSAETLRQRMDEIGASLREEVLRANVSMFNNYEIQPSPLHNGYVPLDIDVTPFDNSKTVKEGVSRTYKGLTVMRRLWPMSELRVFSQMPSCASASSIARTAHPNFCGKHWQCATR